MTSREQPQEQPPVAQASDAAPPPASTQGATALVGVPVPAELLQSDPAILGDSVRGSAPPKGTLTFAPSGTPPVAKSHSPGIRGRQPTPRERAMSIRCTSLVPSPISRILASR